MKSIIFLGMFLILLAVCSSAENTTPFSIGIELPSQLPFTPALRSAIHELGIDYVNYYIKPSHYFSDDLAAEVNSGMLEAMKTLDIDFSIACSYVDPPTSCVREAGKLGEKFKGIVFDEIEHVRLLNLDSPQALADPKSFTSFEQAYQETLKGYQKIHEHFEPMNAPCVATHVWPVLLHVAARAGFHPCPKICKEFYSSVSFAIGMGAALQYEREFWVDCDMWYWDLVPGHPPEEVRSNLMLAYWMGADRIYLEGCGHNLTHPGKQGTPFSIVNTFTDDKYQLTEHGEMLRDFCRNYLSKQQRDWSFRDVEPNIALIHFPDSDYGQQYIHPNPTLYGSPHLKSSSATLAWFSLWNALTSGRTGVDGLNHFKAPYMLAGFERPASTTIWYSYHGRPAQADTHRFFVPLNGVVVFDHLVGYERLKNIPLIYLVGLDLSEETKLAVERRLEEGATVVAWGPLAHRKGLARYEGGTHDMKRGQGTLVLTDDFMSLGVFKWTAPYIGKPNEIKYRFKGKDVVLRKITDNEVDVILPD